MVGPSGVLAQHGDTRHRFALASVTKPLVARAAQVAIEEGVVELDTAAGPPGSTVRHLLAHASGLAMQFRRVDQSSRASAGSTPTTASRCSPRRSSRPRGIEFGQYLTEAVFEPLGMTDSSLDGGAAAAGFGATSTVADLAAFAGELLRPVVGVGADARARPPTCSFPA